MSMRVRCGLGLADVRELSRGHLVFALITRSNANIPDDEQYNDEDASGDHHPPSRCDSWILPRVVPRVCFGLCNV